MRKRYVWERILQKCGEYAEITELLSNNRCLVRFDSGVERECSRHEFARKAVSNNLVKGRYVGERVLQKCGEWAEVIELLPTKYCVVRFDNGVTKTCLSSSFIRGVVCSTSLSSRYVGERILQNYGEYAEIIELLPKGKCKVKFDSGTIRVCERGQFKLGGVSALKRLSNVCIGMRVKQVCGEYAEVIELLPKGWCRVKFDSGVIRKCSKSVFESGDLSYSSKRSKKYVGDRVQQQYEEWAELIELLPSGKCRVRFDNGFEKVCCKSTFSKGRLTSRDISKRFIGEKVMQHCGVLAELVRYASNGRCIIRLEDGSETECFSHMFKKGSVLPNFIVGGSNKYTHTGEIVLSLYFDVSIKRYVGVLRRADGTRYVRVLMEEENE